MTTGGGFRRAVIANIVAQSLGLLLTVAFVLLASRWLGPAGRGVHAIAVTAAQLTALACGLGVAGAVPSFLAGPGLRPTVMLLAATTALQVIGFAVLAGAIAIGGVLPELRGLEVNILAFGICGHFRDAALALSIAQGRVRAAFIVGLVPALVGFGGLLILGDQASAGTALNAQMIGMLAGSLPLLTYRRLVVWPTREGMPGWPALRPALLGYTSTLLSLLMLRADLFVVSHQMGSASAGVYALAQSIGEMLLKLPTWIAMVLTAHVAAQPAGADARTQRLALGSSASALIVAAALLVLRSPVAVVITWVAGADYAAALPLTLWLMPRIIVQSGTAVIAAHLAGLGYTVWHPLHAAMGLVGVALAAVMLTRTYGLTGAAMASAIGYAPAAVVLWIGYQRYRTNGRYA